jgi:hypothetical protein
VTTIVRSSSDMYAHTTCRGDPIWFFPAEVRWGMVCRLGNARSSRRLLLLRKPLAPRLGQIPRVAFPAAHGQSIALDSHRNTDTATPASSCYRAAQALAGPDKYIIAALPIPGLFLSKDFMNASQKQLVANHLVFIPSLLKRRMNIRIGKI